MLNIYQMENMTNKCFFEDTDMVIKLKTMIMVKHVVIWYYIIGNDYLLYQSICVCVYGWWFREMCWCLMMYIYLKNIFLQA